jgi:cysteinyl-tRNA synthetase
MSKSLKNFVAIQDALKLYSADDIRMFYLMHKYDGPLDWSENSMNLAQVEAKQFQTFFQNMSIFLRNAENSLQESQCWTDLEKQLFKKLQTTTACVHDALCDNFDTPKAIQLLKDLISEANRYVSKRQGETADSAIRVPLLLDIVIYISDILRMFGMGPPKDFGIATDKESATFETRAAPILDVFCKFRDRVRSKAIANHHQEYLDLCDWARNEAAPEVGIQIEDRKEGSIFKLRDRDELLSELSVARRLEQEKQEAKERAKAERQSMKDEKAKKKQEQLNKQKQKEDEKQQKAIEATNADAEKK